MILGRDFLNYSGVRLISPQEKKCDTSWNNHVESWEKEILNFDVSDINGASNCEFNINNNLSFYLKQKLSTILSNAIVLEIILNLLKTILDYTLNWYSLGTRVKN